MDLHYTGSGKICYSKKEYKCDLYCNEDEGGILLKIISTTEKMENFFKFPLEIPFLIGKLSTGLKFTLLHLARKGVHEYFSDGYTEFSFYADYILYGVANSSVGEQTFYKLQFTLSNIINWGNQSIYEIGDNFEMISKNHKVSKSILETNNCAISYSIFGTTLPIIQNDLLQENISLKQHGSIEIIFQEEKKFDTFLNVFKKIKHLIEFAMFRKINIENVTAYSKELVYDFNDLAIEQPINIYGKNIQKLKNVELSSTEKMKWINFDDLIRNNSFKNYFEKYETLSLILELFLEPLYTEFNSHIRIFLNIVQALETYHSRFIASNMTEFKDRICLLENKKIIYSEEIKSFLMANSKKFITLESRLADLLLAERNIFFDTGDLTQSEFPSIIARTRNYYIHYNESIKKLYRILSEEELKFYNRSLFKMLEYYILLELGFPKNTFNFSANLSKRWGNISQDLKFYNLLKPQDS